MCLRYLREVQALEPRVLDVRAGPRLHPGVDHVDQLGEHPGLFDQGARDEGGALGEEVQDVQAGHLQEGLVEQLGVPGEPQVRSGLPQPPGQGHVVEAHGEHVVHGEVAQRVQGSREGRGHPVLLAARQSALAGGPDRFLHQLIGEFVQVRGVQCVLLAEGDVRGEAHRVGHQAGARTLRAEELLDQGANTPRPAGFPRSISPRRWSVVRVARRWSRNAGSKVPRR